MCTKSLSAEMTKGFMTMTGHVYLEGRAASAKHLVSQVPTVSVDTTRTYDSYVMLGNPRLRLEMLRLEMLDGKAASS